MDDLIISVFYEIDNFSKKFGNLCLYYAGYFQNLKYVLAVPGLTNIPE